MKKTIELTKETYAGIENNKKVPGVIYLDHETGRLVFKAFNRNKKRAKDKLICELETGWLKESAQRVKFFSSVKKTIPTSNIRMAMSRDMYEGMEVFAKFHNGNGNDNFRRQLGQLGTMLFWYFGKPAKMIFISSSAGLQN